MEIHTYTTTEFIPADDGTTYHNETGSVIIEYNEDGTIKKLTWCLHNKWHRKNKPALIVFARKYGDIIQKTYATNGQIHNESGPAKITYDSYGSTGNTPIEEWYLFDKKLEYIGYLFKEFKEFILKNKNKYPQLALKYNL